MTNEALVTAIILLQDHHIVRVFKTDGTSAIGSIKLDDETGYNVDAGHKNYIHAIWLVPRKTTDPQGDHIQDTILHADKKIYQMVSEFIRLTQISDIQKLNE